MSVKQPRIDGLFQGGDQAAAVLVTADVGQPLCGVACGLFFGEQGPVVAERIEVEELEPGEDRRERPLGHAQLIADVEEVVLDVPLAEPIGRDHVVGGQLANSPQILASGPFDQPGELHVPDHAVSEF